MLPLDEKELSHSRCIPPVPQNWECHEPSAMLFVHFGSQIVEWRSIKKCAVRLGIVFPPLGLGLNTMLAHPRTSMQHDCTGLRQ